MAFRELGLTYDDFFTLPPYKTYIMHMHVIRQREREWEQTRFIAATICNTTPGAKRSIKETELIKLSFDGKKEMPEWAEDEAMRLVEVWPDIKN